MELTCYRNKKVLITGHTGFKGSWLSIWLVQLGAQVIGFSDKVNSDKDNFVLSKLSNKIIDIRGDINDKNLVEEVIFKYQPDFIFHLAAQPLVRESFLQPWQTFMTNMIGTINVLEPLKKIDKKMIIILITTDKVYENRNQGIPFKEEDPLGGYDPYSASKATAEIAIASYRQSFFNVKEIKKHQKFVASVRAGNVIGGGDWSKDRLIPDCIKALESNNDIKIRNPHSIRPWQFVLEPLYGYLLLAEKLYKEDLNCITSFNFGSNGQNSVEVEIVIKEILQLYGSGNYQIVDDGSLHEAKLLLLNSKRAYDLLGWNGVYDYKQAIKETVSWYQRYLSEDVYSICVEQIENYMKEVFNKGGR